MKKLLQVVVDKLMKIDENKPEGREELIVPVDFTPHVQQSRVFNYKPRAIHFILLLLMIMMGIAAGFTLTARSVYIEVNPITAAIKIEGGMSIKLGQRYLIRSGTYSLSLKNEGYYQTNIDIEVSAEPAQTLSYQLEKLPGIVDINTPGIERARVQIDSVDVGNTPLKKLSIAAGSHNINIIRDRYLPYSQTVEIEGRSTQQAFIVNLEPAWANISLSSEPGGADIYVDGERIGQTPMIAEIIQGQRELTLKLFRHKVWQEVIEVVPGEHQQLETVALDQADGLVFIRSTPSGAGVTIDGEFKGQTPLEVSLTPDQQHQISLFKNGYEPKRTSISTQADREETLDLRLQSVTSSVEVSAEPEDAQLYVNGELRGLANQTLELMAASQLIEIRRDGYVPYSTQFTSRPGLDQRISITLKSLEQSRIDQIKPIITTVIGQNLKLFYPNAFTMGASRREAGRRPNENFREVDLRRAFYMGITEVSNADYKSFRKQHSSGTLSGRSQDLASMPAIQLTWNDAALFCNWLSEQESLSVFYKVEDGKVVGFNADSTAYRLPSEAEWAWVSRVKEDGSLLKYSWGDGMPPTEAAGNFADLASRSYLGEIIMNYNDGYLGTAPVASFEANRHGLYDLAGNVAEWVHDIYGSNASFDGSAEIDPLGLQEGQFHLIKGSSWAHGSVTELRLSFRDFGEEPRGDVGFRIARYLEAP
ncbi:MAG: hypothetical protein COC19_02465 [SAR86 cluster bacterium]|uniref:PEGA domain-containing protein n=1 Tax=SAR86 cluster bacterium TaxID=2030880 RepID=A0A2A4MRF4_9GAMM|nr:MAG: hypothetical protein COC19_02465 [SAR86 cluster bacterium]